MKSFLSFFGLIVLPLIFLGVIFWYGWGGKIDQEETLVVREIYGGEIGKVAKNSPLINREFNVLNQFSEEVSISRVYSDCDCLLAYLDVSGDIYGPYGVPTEGNVRPLGLILPAGGIMKMKVSFNPAESPATIFSGKIFIETTKNKPALIIPFKAEVVDR